MKKFVTFIILSMVVMTFIALFSSCSYPEPKQQYITARVILLENNTVSFVHIPKNLDSIYRYDDTVWVNVITHRIDDGDSLTMMAVIK
jgi:hypothetical protein